MGLFVVALHSNNTYPIGQMFCLLNLVSKTLELVADGRVPFVKVSGPFVE